MYRAFGDDSSTFSTLDYRSAKKRKDLIAPHFSRKTVLSMQGVIQEGVSTADPHTCKPIDARNAAA